jgi:hypothetical protein
MFPILRHKIDVLTTWEESSKACLLVQQSIFGMNETVSSVHTSFKWSPPQSCQKNIGSSFTQSQFLSVAICFKGNFPHFKKSNMSFEAWLKSHLWSFQKYAFLSNRQKIVVSWFEIWLRLYFYCGWWAYSLLLLKPINVRNLFFLFYFISAAEHTTNRYNTHPM